MEENFNLHQSTAYNETVSRADSMYLFFEKECQAKSFKLLFNLLLRKNYLQILQNLDCGAFKGIPSRGSSKVCCAKKCGKCGGRGCSKRPGGAKACCAGRIKRECGPKRKAPCRIPAPSTSLKVLIELCISNQLFNDIR